MSRWHLLFPCEGAQLHGTIDDAEHKVGLLIVSGGNEIRSGAFGVQATLAARIAAAGFPVMRFDRRGVGDSEGENTGYRSSAPDIAAAMEKLRHEVPHIERIVGFGNCDAASALMLHSGCGCDALVLANPWTFDDDEDGAMPPKAVRARYLDKLRSPREWLRALQGGVSLRKLASGLRAAFRPSQPPSDLVSAMRAAIARYRGAVTFLVAGRDRTGQAFLEAWGEDARIEGRENADHAFSDEQDFAWLEERLVAALHEQARQLDMG